MSSDRLLTKPEREEVQDLFSQLLGQHNYSWTQVSEAAGADPGWARKNADAHFTKVRYSELSALRRHVKKLGRKNGSENGKAHVLRGRWKKAPLEAPVAVAAEKVPAPEPTPTPTPTPAPEKPTSRLRWLMDTLRAEPFGYTWGAISEAMGLKPSAAQEAYRNDGTSEAPLAALEAHYAEAEQTKLHPLPEGGRKPEYARRATSALEMREIIALIEYLKARGYTQARISEVARLGPNSESVISGILGDRQTTTRVCYVDALRTYVTGRFRVAREEVRRWHEAGADPKRLAGIEPKIEWADPKTPAPVEEAAPETEKREEPKPEVEPAPSADRPGTPFWQEVVSVEGSYRDAPEKPAEIVARHREAILRMVSELDAVIDATFTKAGRAEVQAWQDILTNLYDRME